MTKAGVGVCLWVRYFSFGLKRTPKWQYLFSTHSQVHTKMCPLLSFVLSLNREAPKHDLAELKYMFV